MKADHTSSSDSAGAALIIVLGFIVLVTGLVMAFFARTTTDRQLARSSFANTAADVLARSALEIVVGDFKQEITNGGAPSASTIVPQRSGDFPDVPNLIRRSMRDDGLALPAIKSRASAVNSTDDPSANGRTISKARWNKHYLIPRSSAGSATIDSTPTASFVSPDWVFVTDAGPNEMAMPTQTVVGRYAYVVYDEGGLLDLNVAGFPSANSTDATYLRTIGRKGVLAFADLTATGLSFSAIDNIVGWRNYYSAAPTGYFNATAGDPPFAFPVNPTQFVQYFLESELAAGAERTRDFGIVSTPAGYNAANPRTDQALITRGQLLALRKTLSSDQDALQYIGTFSRDINRPTWSTSATVLAGRFPLSRFDLFTTNALISANVPSIHSYFGLVYVPASAGPPAIAEHWQYVAAVGGAPISTIPAISSNPSLLPLLQYAFPGSSLSELLSITASWIDQCDDDDETTWIEFAPTDPALLIQKSFGVDRNVSTEVDAPPRPTTALVLNRAFRNAGELSYGYRNASTSLDFASVGSSDAPLLDLFTFNTASSRSGLVNLNTRNPGVLSAILRGAISQDITSATATANYVTQAAASSAANDIILNAANGTANNPLLGRVDIPRLVTAASPSVGATKEEREAVARALTEVGQTRTWGLMIDVIAQSGKYPPTASTAADLPKFVVQAEKRYWLHIAIDRFTGKVIDQQLEAVHE